MRIRELLLLVSILNGACVFASAPAQPVDNTPLDGEVYYLVNQLSGLQAESNTVGDLVAQQPRSFTNLSQRWAFGKDGGGLWRIRNVRNKLCLADPGFAAPNEPSEEAGRGVRLPSQRCANEPRPFGLAAPERRSFTACYVAEEPCAELDAQEWVLTATGNGYYTISNKSSGLLIDLSQRSTTAGAVLLQTRVVGAASQSQQWLLRPAFFRGVDNALLEKQESARTFSGVAWWKDAGQQEDVLQIFRDHGLNMVRLRPSSSPPYANVSQAQCVGNACYGETEAQDQDLAKRARNLGMSIELTLLFDGASSTSVPPAWTKDTQLMALQSDLYDYVKAEILAYRRAGTMPDLVSIGNEVDTGFLGSIGSPTGANFGGFAALQSAAFQAVKDAAADTSAGPAIPPPLTCIHITPAWDLTQFFTLANQFNISYDAICQSYYPIFHGPLTQAQAAQSNPGNKPVEQAVLVNAATNLGKPIFIIEAGEHFESGFQSNDPWYAPPTPSLQRQFLLDLQAVEKGLPNTLGLGIEYWDPAGVNIPSPGGGLFNGDNRADAIYVWNGLTLFDDADSTLLPGIDALGGKLDPTLNYKFVNLASGEILSVYQASNAAGASLDVEPDNGIPALSQQWRISSENDGYFHVSSLNPRANALADAGGSTLSGSAIVQSPPGSGPELEWDIVSAGNGRFRLVNRASGLVLDLSGGFAAQEPRGEGATQQWQIVPVY